jgi:putative thioredoxin
MVNIDTYTVEVNAQNFQTEVAEKSQQIPVLLEFYAEGAEQCVPTSQLLSKLVAEYQGKFLLARVDIQQNQQLVQQLQVRSLPTIKVIFEGQMAGDFEGPTDEQQLRAALDQLTQSPLERVREQIDLLVAQGERSEAIQMLQTVIAAEPSNFALHVELCDLLIMEGQADEARKILAGLPADTQGIAKPKSRLEFIELAGDLGSLDELKNAAEANADDLQVRFNYAIKLIVEDQVETSLQELLQIMIADKTWEEELARTTMIKVFNMLGKGDELATAYRRKMFTHLH